MKSIIFAMMFMFLGIISVPAMAQETTETPTTVVGVSPQRVTFKGYDDLEIVATMYTPEVIPAPALLLIHEAEGKKEVWYPFAREWAEQGYVVVAIDARHHGETKGYGGWADVLKDLPLVLAQMKAMPAVKSDALGIIGASIGGGAAYFACAFEESCKTAVLLSPASLGFSPQLVDNFGKRSVMVVAAQNDGNFANTAKEFEDDPGGKAEVTIVAGSDHGTQILYDLPEMVKKIDDWLAVELPISNQAVEATAEATAEATSSP